jgi:hypothetical protein
MTHFAHFVIIAVVSVVHRWATIYSDSKSISGVTTFIHLGGMLLGGGFAIATDRLTLRAYDGSPGIRQRQLDEIHAVHGPVLLGLTLMFSSGALMLAADFSNLATSPVFWTKSALIVMLLANGGVMQHAETHLRTSKDGHANRYWHRLRFTSLASLGLWFAVALAGTLLTVFA